MSIARLKGLSRYNRCKSRINIKEVIIEYQKIDKNSALYFYSGEFGSSYV